jgi:hypothetical protein
MGEKWWEFLEEGMEDNEKVIIRVASKTGQPPENEEFIRNFEVRIGRSLRPRNREESGRWSGNPQL